MRYLSALTLATAFVLPLQATEFTIDPTHASAAFSVDHLGISETHGLFKDVSGAITFDEAKPEAASVTVNIAPASVDTANADRDKHLRNADFLDVGRFKELKFVSSGFKKTDDAKVFHVTGDLTLHGVTKTITVPVTYNGQATDPWKNERIGFTTTFSVKRSDYGMTYGAAMIGDEVTFTLSVEGIKNK